MITINFLYTFLENPLVIGIGATFFGALFYDLFKTFKPYLINLLGLNIRVPLFVLIALLLAGAAFTLILI